MLTYCLNAKLDSDSMAMVLSCVREIEGEREAAEVEKAMGNNIAYVPRGLSSKQVSNVFAVLTTYYFNEKDIGLVYQEVIHDNKNGWEIIPIHTETIPPKVKKDKIYQKNFLDRYAQCMKNIQRAKRKRETIGESFSFPNGRYEMEPRSWSCLYQDLANELKRTQGYILRRAIAINDDGNAESRWQLVPERHRSSSKH